MHLTPPCVLRRARAAHFTRHAHRPTAETRAHVARVRYKTADMDDDVDVVGDRIPGGGARVNEAAALAALEALFGDGDEVEDEADVRRKMRAAARANNPGGGSDRIALVAAHCSLSRVIVAAVITPHPRALSSPLAFIIHNMSSFTPKDPSPHRVRRRLKTSTAAACAISARVRG